MEVDVTNRKVLNPIRNSADEELYEKYKALSNVNMRKVNVDLADQWCFANLVDYRWTWKSFDNYVTCHFLNEKDKFLFDMTWL